MSGSCSVLTQIKNKLEKSQAPKVIAGGDGKTSLTVPDKWRPLTTLHEEAKLQAADVVAEQYAIVISESKAGFADDMTLDDFTELIMTAPKEAVTDLKVADPAPFEVNGYQARQFEAAGTVDKIKIKWIFTTIEAPKNFHQIVMWTTPAKFEENEKIFQDVVKSFQETEGKPAAPAKRD
jgi:hypothetical protein